MDYYDPVNDRRIDPERRDASPTPPAGVTGWTSTAEDLLPAAGPVERLQQLLDEDLHPRDAALLVLPEDRELHDVTLRKLLSSAELQPAAASSASSADFGDAVAWACLISTDLRLLGSPAIEKPNG